MKTLTRQLERYLLHRRNFGYDLEFTERVLRKFTEYADVIDQDRVTTELFLGWQANYGSADNNTWARRLGMVRGFATWLQQIDGVSQVPPLSHHVQPLSLICSHQLGSSAETSAGGNIATRTTSACLLA